MITLVTVIGLAIVVQYMVMSLLIFSLYIVKKNNIQNGTIIHLLIRLPSLLQKYFFTLRENSHQILMQGGTPLPQTAMTP